MKIKLKTVEQTEKMRVAGRLVHRILHECAELCKPGVTTQELDDHAGRRIEEAGAFALFKNYPTYRPGEGFPGNLCISVNDEVVHGIPGDRQIQDGDIVSLDCGVRIDGWCGDSAFTVLGGQRCPRGSRTVRHDPPGPGPGD